LPTNPIDMWEELIAMMLLGYMSKGLGDYTINSDGIAIDMDEIKKAEKMYEEEKSD